MERARQTAKGHGAVRGGVEASPREPSTTTEQQALDAGESTAAPTGTVPVGGPPMTRARECEQRLRDSYPQILRDAGLDEAMIDDLMAAYDSPFVDTQSPVSAASQYGYKPPSRPAG